jgi:hypothetical protein
MLEQEQNKNYSKIIRSGKSGQIIGRQSEKFSSRRLLFLNTTEY